MAKTSLRAKLFYHYLLYTEAKHLKQLETSRNFLSESPHKTLHERAMIRVETKDTYPIWQITPKKSRIQDSNQNPIILYLYNSRLHQGIRKHHWEFVLDLLDSDISDIIVPEIPTNHNKTISESLEWVNNYLKVDSLNQEQSIKDWIILAEGSSALYSFYLLNELKLHHSLPIRELVLISPWLDCSFSNPLIDQLLPKDPIHNKNGYQSWLGEVMDSESSTIPDLFYTPIYQKLTQLPPIKVYSAGKDILQADAFKLKVRAISEPIIFNYYEYSEMFNEWYHYPIPEREAFLSLLKAQLSLPLSEWEKNNELDASYW
ncbi:MAG: hypothetical protein EBR32_02755 [Bacteroidetes bacterium]|nr:hypothetical protein [Bacteroidota bacterium]